MTKKQLDGVGTGSFNNVLNNTPDLLKTVLEHGRNIIINIFPDVTEVAWTDQDIVSYGIGPKKMKEHFVYMRVYKKHITLGFYNGANLKDENNLLEGTGKKMRNLKITNKQDVDNQAVQSLIRLALEDIQKINSV